MFKRKHVFLILLACAFYLFLPPKIYGYNVILNSSYEIWFDSVGIRMPFGWYTSEASDSGSAVRTADMHSGIYALKLTGSDTLAYATTLSFVTAGQYYKFSGWSKVTSSAFVGGSYIITWLKLSQQPMMDPVIIPILRHTSYYNNTQIVQAPDSAVMVSINITVLPQMTVYFDDVTLSDTVLTAIEENEIAGVALRQQRNNFVIYPNPAKTDLTIHFPSHTGSSVIEIFDVSGNLVKVKKFKGSKDENVALDDIKNGIYFLVWKSEHNQGVEKFIVQK